MHKSWIHWGKNQLYLTNIDMIKCTFVELVHIFTGISRVVSGYSVMIMTLSVYSVKGSMTIRLCENENIPMYYKYYYMTVSVL